MNKLILVIIASIVIIIAASISIIIVPQNNSDNNLPKSTEKNYFPSKKNQYLIYEITEGSNRLFKVIESTTIEGKDVMKILYGSGYTDFNSISRPQYFFTDEFGRILKLESWSGYATFDYDSMQYYNNITDETIEFSDDYMNSNSIFMSSWWKNQELSVGKTFSYKVGETPDLLLNISFNVIRVEDIELDIGLFNSYYIEASLYRDDNSTIYKYWVDKDTFTLLRWMTSSSNGDDLIDMQL